MTQKDYLCEKYFYDEETGFLHLKTSRSKSLIGKQIGSLFYPKGRNKPYIRFNIQTDKRAKKFGFPVNMFAHRAIWIMKYGDIPDGYQIDHIDHDGTNNRISNLRCVTAQENQRNRKLDIRNTSGHTGITIRKNGFEVSTKHFGKTIYIGKYKTIDEAIAARNAFYLAEGTFHENHGLSDESGC